ncbi:MAG: tRNA (adenosine(37)-N6)-threonylcarbamoyltransferase complex transferase subunit TsaD [Firmicutes bacterium]|nr:tRNA (adenosine(37)-N6)-threonylcarbamoyltransferase complex transferase subunit TsaD [Bacillota bacterium]
MYTPLAKEKFDSLTKKANEGGPITILAIETSCDETAVSVVKDGRQILSNVIASQIDIHQKFGGVVPEVASRNHTLAINSCIEKAILDARVDITEIDAIAVTYGAGLLGALLVGISSAKALAYTLKIPLIKVNHIEAHICANFIEYKDLTPPFLAVVASGGHTNLYEVEDYNKYVPIGGTTDDALGEAFDKVARLLGLPYPGGPEIEKLAKTGQATIKFFKNPKASFNKDLSLSYSGLKTAVVNYINNARQRGEKLAVNDICASFTKQAVDMLVDTAIYAVKNRGIKNIALAGGVASNSYLREKLIHEAEKIGAKVFIPPSILCTDNASMIASRAYFSILSGENIADLTLNAKANLCYNA